MEIIVTKQDKQWNALLKIDGYADNRTANRPGCAIRDVLNRFEYAMGKPADNLTVRIDGW